MRAQPSKRWMFPGRITLTNMTVDLGCKNGIVAPDR